MEVLGHSLTEIGVSVGSWTLDGAHRTINTFLMRSARQVWLLCCIRQHTFDLFTCQLAEQIMENRHEIPYEHFRVYLCVIRYKK
jgi:hypothetical protein